MLVCVALFGLVPMVMGVGYFGWRLFRFDRVSLTMVNATPDDITLEVGNVTEECAARKVCSIEFRAGDVTLTTYDDDGSEIESIDFFTDNRPVFYNYAGVRCYAVVDVSRFYTGAQTDAWPYEIIGRIYEDDRIFVVPGSTFIKPGGILPDTLAGGHRPIWIDRASCHLLEEDNEHLLIGQLNARMQSRQERRAEEERRLQEQLRQQQQ